MIFSHVLKGIGNALPVTFRTSQFFGLPGLPGYSFISNVLPKLKDQTHKAIPIHATPFSKLSRARQELAFYECTLVVLRVF